MHSDNDQIIKIRHEIDKIDTDIIHLLARRFKAVQRIGRVKKKSNLRVTDSERELSVQDRLNTLAQEKNLDLNFLKRIWKEILMESYRIQLQSAADE